MTLDINDLLKAVDNENNASMMRLNSSIIKQKKNDILQKLGLRGENLAKMHEKLKEYRYIENLNDLNYNAFVRWIDISDPEDVFITNGAMVREMIAQDDTVIIKCMGFRFSTYSFDFNKCLVFQKFNKQEKVLLFALDNLT